MNRLDVTPMPLTNTRDWLWNPFVPVTVHGLYIPMGVAKNIAVEDILVGLTSVLVGGSVPGTSFAVPGGVGLLSTTVLVPGMSARLRVTRKNDWKEEGQAILYVSPIKDRKMIERYADSSSDPPHPDGFGGEDYPNAPAVHAPVVSPMANIDIKAAAARVVTAWKTGGPMEEEIRQLSKAIGIKS